MRVLLIGENIYKSRSGVVTVLKQLLESKTLKNTIVYKTIYTTGDEFPILKKIIGWSEAYIKFLIYIPKTNIVHVHHAIALNFWLTAVLVYATKLFGKKIILHNHAADFHLFYNECSSFKKRMIINVFSAAHINIILSTSWLTWYTSIAPKAKWVLLPNSIQLPDNVIKKNLNASEIILIYLARIEERKGFYTIMNIMPTLIKEYKYCKLYLAGQGDLKAVEKLIKKTNLSHNVTVLGHIDNQQKDELLRRGHLLLLPSYNEGLPMALLEAMSYGIVPITTPVGGIPDVVESGKTGILIAPGDEDALLEAIRSLLNNSNLYNHLSDKAKQIICNEYNLCNYTKKLNIIYNSLYH